MTTEVAEANNTHGSQPSEVQAYSLGIANNRGLMIALGLSGCITLLVGIRYSLISPLFTPLDTAIFVGGLCVYGPCTALLLMIKSKYLYHVMVPWIGCTLVLGACLTLNSIFGSNSSRLLEDQVPIYLAYIPVLVVFAYTYLTTRHAAILCSAYSAILAASGGIFVVLHWSVAINSPAVIFLMLTFLIANPAVMGMMHLTRSLHLEVNRHLEWALRVERKKMAAAAHASRIDPVTLTFNRDGIAHSIETAIARNDSSDNRFLLLAIMMDHHVDLAKMQTKPKWGQVLRLICATLKSMPDQSNKIGRLGGTQFLIWSESHDPPENPVALSTRILKKLQALDWGLQPPPSFSIGIVRSRPGQSADMLIEAANFQLFLAQGRGGGQVCVDQEA